MFLEKPSKFFCFSEFKRFVALASAGVLSDGFIYLISKIKWKRMLTLPFFVISSEILLALNYAYTSSGHHRGVFADAVLE